MDEAMVADRPGLFDGLDEQPSDSLLALIALAEADPRPEKIDVGVGVYRDAAGGTPILKAVKAAERRLIENQRTKAYLGSQGDVRFVELIKAVVFGEGAAADPRIVGVQTPGGCGARSGIAALSEPATFPGGVAQRGLGFPLFQQHRMAGPGGPGAYRGRQRRCR